MFEGHAETIAVCALMLTLRLRLLLEDQVPTVYERFLVILMTASCYTSLTISFFVLLDSTSIFIIIV